MLVARTGNEGRKQCLCALPDVAVAVVDFLYGPLASDPYRVGKPLRFDLVGFYSARRGMYRVIYSIHDEEVLVVVVAVVLEQRHEVVHTKLHILDLVARECRRG